MVTLISSRIVKMTFEGHFKSAFNAYREEEHDAGKINVLSFLS